MRTYEELRQILVVYEQCGGMNETARRTGLPRTTVQRYIKKYWTVENFDAEYNAKQSATTIYMLTHPLPEYSEIHKHYAYILGMYLGDGHISNTRDPKTYRMMIYLDKKYRGIIDRCVNSIEVLMPQNKVSVVNRGSWIYVSCYSRSWLKIIPQHGAGKKHDRRIILEDWQQYIVDQYPLEFLTGLYHSDGSRSQNIVNGKNYPRYTFSNASDDIRKLFTYTAEKLGLSWTTANARNVAISRRDDVAWLDEHVGAKV